MNDPHRTERFGPPQPGSRPSEPQGSQNPPLVDPAYADQAPYAPTYGGPPPPVGADLEPTQSDPAVAAVLATRPAPAGWDAHNAAHGAAAGGSEIAALVVDCRSRSGAAGGRTGHRADHRQRHDENPDRGRAVAPDARAKFGSARADDEDAHSERRSAPATTGVPGAPTESTNPARCSPSSTTSAATAARSASPTWTPAT